MEPRGYYDPPSEREWTPEERQDFYIKTGNYLDSKQFPKPSGIHVTSITPPAQGWPVAMYCPICKETTFILSPWAMKPVDGDYFKMNGVCGRDETHNLTMALSHKEHRRHNSFGIWDAL